MYDAVHASQQQQQQQMNVYMLKRKLSSFPFYGFGCKKVTSPLNQPLKLFIFSDISSTIFSFKIFLYSQDGGYFNIAFILLPIRRRASATKSGVT